MVAAIGILLRAACLLATMLAGVPAQAQEPLALHRGVNITDWFRFPLDRDPMRLARYLSDQALAELRTAGFDFVRLAVDPDVVVDSVTMDALIDAIARIERAGFSVIVSPHPVRWQLEAEPQRLRQFWRRLAPRLRALNPARTLPETVNEPVFADDPAAWVGLQHAVLAEIRAALPRATVVLTGADWGSIRGLLALPPEDDPRVLYSFHFYDPPELTVLAAYRPGLDTAALARLPFPAPDRAACTEAGAATADSGTIDIVHYYCVSGWEDAALRRRIRPAAVWARAQHVRLLAGEFGASAALNSAARMAWLHAVSAAFTEANIPWALWGYDDVMGLNVPRPPPPHPLLDPAVLQALGMTAEIERNPSHPGPSGSK